MSKIFEVKNVTGGDKEKWVWVFLSWRKGSEDKKEKIVEQLYCGYRENIVKDEGEALRGVEVSLVV